MLQSTINESQTPTTSSSSLMSNENLFASSASNTAISSAKTISSIMSSKLSVAPSNQVAGSSNESQTSSTASTNSNSNALMAVLMNKFSNEQAAPATNYNAENFDASLFLAEFGIGSVEEIAQNELFKSLIQSITASRDDEFTSTASTNSIQDSTQINNELINTLFAQNPGVKSSSQSNNRLSNADFVASAF